MRGICCLVFWAAMGPVFGASPAELLEQIDRTRLDPSRAVEVRALEIQIPMGALRIASGTLYPASAVAGRPVEMVFVGDAILAVDPKDEIENDQMQFFTGSELLEEPITAAVLVVCHDPAVDVLFDRDSPASADVARQARAVELFDTWKNATEREILDVRASVLMDALGDPAYADFFAGQFESEDLGTFLMVFEPDSAEQLSIGKFERIEVTEKEKNKAERYMRRQQRRGRLLGLDVEGLGSFDQWMLTPLRNESGEASPGSAAFESLHYELDVEIDHDAENIHGTARLRLEAVTGQRRMIDLQLSRDLKLKGARNSVGDDLFFVQGDTSAFVLLDEAPSPGDRVEIEVDFGGAMIYRVQSKLFALRDTLDWYPRVGDADRATYEAKMTWPKNLEMLASGKVVKSGKTDDGRHWALHRVENPVMGFSFELGKFDRREFDAGHVHVTFALDKLAVRATETWILDQIEAVITDGMAFYEELFGPYPLDYLTVVTVPRPYAQGLLGFVTLPSTLAVDLGILQMFGGLEDRRTVVAHELAHQWWGNLVGWKSYRDQWLSEAMANYAALQWARSRLAEVFHVGPTSGWIADLTSVTATGRPVERVGPLVLGTRLGSTRAPEAYEAIVYKKGAVVLSMLGYFFGEEQFVQFQKHLLKAARFKDISTEEYLAAMEKMSGTDLGWFGDQYIFGTGLPEVYYTYEIGEPRDGTWPIRIVTRQQTPYHYVYRVEAVRDGVLDIRRDIAGQIDVGESSVIVPFQVSVHDPDADDGKGKKKNKKGSKTRNSKKDDEWFAATLNGRLALRGESTELEIPSEYEPNEFWLDRENIVFGRFYNEDRAPKRVLYFQGLDKAAANDTEGAEALFHKAVAAEVGDASTDAVRRRERETVDAQALMQLAELNLDHGKTETAREFLSRARKSVSGFRREYFADDFRTVEARIEILEGNFEGALKRLKKAERRRSSRVSLEGYLIMAIAAREVGDEEALETALEVARDRGAEVSVLE